MACDDHCELHFSKLANDVSSKEKILDVSVGSGAKRRDYYEQTNEDGDFTQISEWISLT